MQDVTVLSYAIQILDWNCRSKKTSRGKQLCNVSMHQITVRYDNKYYGKVLRWRPGVQNAWTITGRSTIADNEEGFRYIADTTDDGRSMYS
ncbi:unnamed protein product [Orchesella dallaii]|uniref:Uncharacterized protein n=1 Tax=Orchesella dallaii TaxID=48710 RepID=A0ABP1R674_9HEXA